MECSTLPTHHLSDVQTVLARCSQARGHIIYQRGHQKMGMAFLVQEVAMLGEDQGGSAERILATFLKEIFKTLMFQKECSLVA